MHSDSPDDELDMRAAQEAILGTRDEALDDDELDMLEAQEALLGARDAGAQSAGEPTNKTEFPAHGGRERRGGRAAEEADFHGMGEKSSMDVGNKALIAVALAVMVVAAVYIANSWLHFI